MSGALNHSPSDVIRWLIIGLGHGTDPDDGGNWPVFAGSEPDTPDNCITVFGTTPIKQGRTQHDGEIQERYGIMVRLRSATYPVGYAKLNDIAIAFDQNVYDETVTIDGTSYLVHSVSRVSGPLDLGKEVGISDRLIFSLNVTALVQQS